MEPDEEERIRRVLADMRRTDAVASTVAASLFLLVVALVAFGSFLVVHGLRFR